MENYYGSVGMLEALHRQSHNPAFLKKDGFSLGVLVVRPPSCHSFLDLDTGFSYFDLLKAACYYFQSPWEGFYILKALIQVARSVQALDSDEF
jgi:hypothetical protein